MYQALYRKWRPRTFADVAGQEHITDTLRRQVAAGRLSHAYLFTGTRGTGKTSCAKILARAVNCEHPKDGEPCNECPSCRGIESGSILDVVELDAASNNRVDDIRSVLDEGAYTPAAVKKRVYIIDEVHMLSGQAFNALLQTLEEPPEHLMFILATTEIHKVPATIKSRCQQFSFKRLRAETIAARLAFVAEQEGLELSGEGAELLARLADGGMRDALSLLDQCAGEGRRIGEAEILATLGLAGNLETARLMESVARGDTGAALERLDRLYAGGKEMFALLGELSALTRDLLIRRTAPHAGASLMTGGYDAAVLKELGGLLSTPRLVQMLGALQRTAGELARSPNRRTDAELCLVSLCDPSLDGSPAGLAARVAALEERMASTAPPVGAHSVRPPADNPHPAVPGAPFQRGQGVRSPVSPLLKGGVTGEVGDGGLVSPPPEEGPTYDDDPPPWAWEEEDAGRPEAGPCAPAIERAYVGGGVPDAPHAPAPPPMGVSWSALRARLEPVMNVADFCFVGNPEMVSGSVEGETVTLWAESELVKTFIDTPAVLELVGRTAGELLGRPCRTVVKVGKAPVGTGPAPAPAEHDALDDLLGLENVTVT